MLPVADVRSPFAYFKGFFSPLIPLVFVDFLLLVLLPFPYWVGWLGLVMFSHGLYFLLTALWPDFSDLVLPSRVLDFDFMD